MKKLYSLLFLLAVCIGHSFAADPELDIVCDGTRRAPLANLVCMVAGDDARYINIVLKDQTITGVSKITFEKSAGISLPAADKTDIIHINGSLHITNCRPGAHIAVSDMQGRTVLQHTLEGTSASLDLSELANGMYVATIDGHCVKFVKR